MTDAIGGILTLCVLLLLSYLPSVKIYYRQFGVIVMTLNFLLNIICLIGTFLLEIGITFEKAYLYMICEILFCCLTPCNFFVFFNFSYSLSAQHTIFYLSGMSCGTFIVSILASITKLSPVYCYGLLSILSLFGLIACIILFFFVPRVFNSLIMQEKIDFGREYLHLANSSARTQILTILKKNMLSMKSSLINIFLMYFFSVFLAPRFLNPLQRHYLCFFDEDHPEETDDIFRYIQITSFLYYLGDVIGRLATLVFKLSLRSCLIISIVSSILMSVTILPIYFATAGNVDIAKKVEYFFFVYGPIIGFINGYIVCCSVEYSITHLEPRFAVSIVVFVIYLGVFFAFLAQSIFSIIDNVIAHEAGNCPHCLFELF